MAIWNNIPKENRQDLIDVFYYIKARLPTPPEEHLLYLFEAYNKFIEPYNHKKITCRNDRATVLNVFSNYVKIWKEQEQTLQK